MSTAEWGEHSLSFRLATASLNVWGLSAHQCDVLSRCYSEFVGPATTSPRGGNPSPPSTRSPECRAYRLTNAPRVTTEALTRDGQYTPLKVRTLCSIELTGINFRASIDTRITGGCSSLGVAYEHELAKGDVFENFLRVYSAHQALAQGGVILHSSGVAFDDKAYIFVGRSGAGKTTLARKAHAEGGLVLSDDVNLLLPRYDAFRAFAVPFTGEFGRTLREVHALASYPVAALVLLERGERLHAATIKASQAVAKLLVGSPFVNMDTDESAALFDVVTGLIRRVPFVALQCAREDSASDIISLVRRHIGDPGSTRAH
ncbi:MAG: hypothetical protein WB783_08550 [Arenicellales bacterium]